MCTTTQKRGGEIFGPITENTKRVKIAYKSPTQVTVSIDIYSNIMDFCTLIGRKAIKHVSRDGLLAFNLNKSFGVTHKECAGAVLRRYFELVSGVVSSHTFPVVSDEFDTLLSDVIPSGFLTLRMYKHLYMESSKEFEKIAKDVCSIGFGDWDGGEELVEYFEEGMVSNTIGRFFLLHDILHVKNVPIEETMKMTVSQYVKSFEGDGVDCYDYDSDVSNIADICGDMYTSIDMCGDVKDVICKRKVQYWVDKCVSRMTDEDKSLFGK